MVAGQRQVNSRTAASGCEHSCRQEDSFTKIHPGSKRRKGSFHPFQTTGGKFRKALGRTWQIHSGFEGVEGVMLVKEEWLELDVSPLGPAAVCQASLKSIGDDSERSEWVPAARRELRPPRETSPRQINSQGKALKTHHLGVSSCAQAWLHSAVEGHLLESEKLSW